VQVGYAGRYLETCGCLRGQSGKSTPLARFDGELLIHGNQPADRTPMSGDSSGAGIPSARASAGNFDFEMLFGVRAICNCGWERGLTGTGVPPYGQEGYPTCETTRRAAANIRLFGARCLSRSAGRATHNGHPLMRRVLRSEFTRWLVPPNAPTRNAQSYAYAQRSSSSRSRTSLVDTAFGGRPRRGRSSSQCIPR